MHACQVTDVRFPAACDSEDSWCMHACQLNDVRVDRRRIRAVCTPANLMRFGSQQRAIRAVGTLASLMMLVSTSVGFVAHARLPT